MITFRTLAALVVALPMAFTAHVAFAGGDAASGEKLVTEKGCVACHGADGNSTLEVNPKLAGQYEGYLVRALSEYKSGARQSATMAGFVADLTAQDIRDLAAWFARQESDLTVLSK